MVPLTPAIATTPICNVVNPSTRITHIALQPPMIAVARPRNVRTTVGIQRSFLGTSLLKLSPTAPLSLEGCPDWFTRACGYLATIPARDHFRQLHPVFQELEHSSDFATGKGTVHALGNKNRLEAIHWWISRARTGQPPIQIQKFSGQFWAWWSSLQPSWRVLPNPAEGEPFQLPRDRNVEGDWSALDKPGLNGFYSVIAALGWWGAALTTDSSSDWEVSFWEMAVDDVKWTMQQIVRSRNT